MSAGINEKTNMLKFYIYRLWRLLTPYWFTLVTLNIIYIILHREFFYPNLLFFLGDTIPVLDMIGLTYNMFDGVFWYMNFTLFLVFIMPVIYELTRRFNVIPLIMTVIIYRLIPTVINSPYGGRYASYLFAAGLGVLFQQKNVFGNIQKRFNSLAFAGKGACLAGLILCSALCPFVGLAFKESVFGFDSMLFTAGAIAVILIGFLFLTSRFISKPLTFLGKYSYDMFLIHVLLYKKAIIFLRALRYVALQYIASVLLCLLAAYILYLLKKYTGWSKLTSKVMDASFTTS